MTLQRYIEVFGIFASTEADLLPAIGDIAEVHTRYPFSKKQSSDICYLLKEVSESPLSRPIT